MSEEIKEATKEVTDDAKSELYEIWFNGKFSEGDLETPIKQLNATPSNSSLLFWINSNGGNPAAGMALDEKIKSKGFKVTYISHLFNGSFGCILPLLHENAVRLAYPHSIFTFHGQTATVSGQEEEFNNVLSYAKYQAVANNNKIMEVVGLTKKEFAQFNGIDKIFFAFQLFDIGTYGFFDGIIQKELGSGVFLIKTRDGNKLYNANIHTKADIKNLPIVE